MVPQLLLAGLLIASPALAGGSSGSHHSSSTTSHTKAKSHTSKSKKCSTCARDSHGKIERSEKAKTDFIKRTGYPHGRPGYVVDHIRPLKSVGNDVRAASRGAGPASCLWRYPCRVPPRFVGICPEHCAVLREGRAGQLTCPHHRHHVRTRVVMDRRRGHAVGAGNHNRVSLAPELDPAMLLARVLDCTERQTARLVQHHREAV